MLVLFLCTVLANEGSHLSSGMAASPRVAVDVDLGDLRAFDAMWRKCVGSGHAALWSRADWRAHLKIVAEEIGFELVRGHGILDNSVMYYDACPNDGHHTHSNCPNPPCDKVTGVADGAGVGIDTMSCTPDKDAAIGSYVPTVSWLGLGSSPAHDA